jgi:hypothetical protein
MTKSVPFRVQSHVLKLLGDELIGHDRLAVFELVKNAYDADAKVVDVTLSLDSSPPTIKILDNGYGMSADTIEKAWLEIGTDSKRGPNARKRTELGRAVLGEKGVGRLAIQKLGTNVRLVTRTRSNGEHELSIDWPKLIESAQYLEGGLQVQIKKNNQPVDIKTESGTLIEITGLHRNDWTRREVRDLFRLISSLNNPFDLAESFQVNLHLPGREDEIKGLPTLQEMIDAAVWVFEFKLLANGKLDWKYTFSPPKFKGLTARTNEDVQKLPLLEPDEDELPIASDEPTTGKKQKKRLVDQDRIFLQPKWNWSYHRPDLRFPSP